MNNIVVAFPKAEIAKSIKRILAQSGYSVSAVTSTGASTLTCMQGLDSGIVICGYRFSDMMYSEILQTLEMMDYSITRRRKKMRQRPKARSDQDREMIEQAKAVLMERNSFSEDEAHRYIQKRSMDNGTGLVETAQMILSLMTEV